jgi:hypothetical protein
MVYLGDVGLVEVPKTNAGSLVRNSDVVAHMVRSQRMVARSYYMDEGLD